MNKKGNSLLEILVIKIIPVVLLIVALFIVVMAWWSIFVPKKVNELDSFNALADHVELMLRRDKPFEYVKTILIISDKYELRGFSSNDAGKDPLCKDQTKSCLCLRTISNSKMLACRSLTGSLSQVNLLSLNDDEDRSVPTSYPDQFKSIGVGTPLFYSNLIVLNIAPQGIKGGLNLAKGEQFYIEKYDSGSEVNILVAPIKLYYGLQDTDVERRINGMSTCPEDSATECTGKMRNSRVGSGFCSYIDGKCTYSNEQPCTPDVKADKKCICGVELMDPGLTCFETAPGMRYADSLDCSKITSCQDYCKIDDAAFSCTKREAELCALNLCKNSPAKNCKVEHVVSGGTGGSGGYTPRSEWDVCN